ncbi:hypothetical protein [Nocardia sputi]|uniref:hypothetical protein n=1 Tax=Nocardia sputi TaxID=2943705 RepID=UPI0020C14FD4|nr:hypothetical protein [Nocardia sputi]
MSSAADRAVDDYNKATVAYLLRRFGWRLSYSIPQSYEVWSNETVPEQEILLPINPAKGDYAQLLRRAFKMLIYEHGAEVEHTSRLLMFQQRSDLESTKWTKETPVDAGMIAWEEGERLFAAARLSLVAAAKATKESRRYFGNTAAYVARRFLESTFMGQTEVGSFVVTAYTPSDRYFYFSKAIEDAAPGKLFETRNRCRTGAEILDKFDEITAATRSALDEYQSRPRVEIFDDLVQTGMSYEMSSALSSLCMNGDGAVTIIRKPTHSGREVRYEYRFDAVESPILRKVADRFAETREPEQVNLTGEVTLLAHESATERRLIRLHVYNRPDIRIVRVELSEEQYELALEAHRQDKPLKLSGTVHRVGRYQWLTDPVNVELFPEGSNDDPLSEPH